MKLSLWIAKMLAPEIFREAHRYRRMLGQIQYERQWLGHDFPEIGAFAERAIVSDYNHWRALDDAALDSKWASDISAFREQLRRGEAKTNG